MAEGEVYRDVMGGEGKRMEGGESGWSKKM
jgi:hypothetical protein